MTITKTDFENYAPSGIDATGNVFEKMGPFLKASQETVKYDYVGETAFTAIAALPDRVSLSEIMIKTIVLDAFIAAIPHLDLILTPNGFAVASTTQIAPASKERVASLTRQTQRDLDTAIELLVAMIMGDTGYFASWTADGVAYSYIRSIIYKSSYLKRYFGEAHATYSDLLNALPAIYEAENIVAKFISDDYLSELLDKTKKQELVDADKKILPIIFQIIGLIYQKREYKRKLYQLVNILEKDLVTYKTYADSKEYTVKHTTNYENKQADPTFFSC